MALTERTKSQRTVPPQPVVTKVQARRRPSAVLPPWLVAAVLVLGLVLGTVGGYVAYQLSSDATARGRVADVARLQGQANAYVEAQEALARGRAADTARLQAQGDAFLQGQQALARGRAADTARLQAQADAYQAR